MSLLPYSSASGKSPLTLDTKANILASTATAGKMVYSTDTNELYLADGLVWKKIVFVLATQSATPDIGAYQDSSPIGIFATSATGDTNYISGYSLDNVLIGGTGTAKNGGIRFNNNFLQVYANGAWNNVVIGFTFSELTNYGYALTHLPTGLTYPLEVMSGNSITRYGLNGLPVTQGYVTDIGAYPSYQSVGGAPIN